MFDKRVKYGLFCKDKLLLFTILAIAETCEGYENENCILSTISKDPVCIGEVRCVETFAITSKVIETWDCNFSYDSYILNIKLENVTDDILDDDIDYDNDVSDHVKVITITNEIGITAVPMVTYELFSEIVDINLSNNMIESITLDAFSGLVLLRTLNVSHNVIKEIVLNFDIRMRPTSSAVKVIDLSFNNIKKIESDSFKHFSQLIYLNLSYNKINSINEGSFEGLINLETLWLSYNRITFVGLAFTPLINLKQLLLDHNNLPSLLEIDFVTLTDLVKLDVSFNNLKYIDDYTFSNLKSLSEVDLSNNDKCFSSKTLFVHNLGVLKIQTECYPNE